MCQLTLVNTRNAILNGLFLTPLLMENSVGNSDGTGFLTVGESNYTLYKVKDAARDLAELGLDIRDSLSDYPILAHVRAASKGIVVTNENAHPFDGKRFVLAHNGRLYKKDEQVQWDSSRSDDASIASDSMVFLEALDAQAKKTPKAPILDVLNKTMAEFKGKFALLIYDKKYDKHYVCRGSTADLCIMRVGEVPVEGGDVTPIGFIVNTKRTTLEDAAKVACQMAQIATGRRIVLETPKELKKDTVYEVDGIELKELGEMKENAVSFTYQGSRTSYGADTKNYKKNGATSSTSANLNVPVWSLASAIQKWMEKHFLGIPDVDAILYLFLGKGMADLELADLETFVKVVIPKISAPKKVREELAKHITSGGQIYSPVYREVPMLQYPWTINGGKEMEALVKYIKHKK